MVLLAAVALVQGGATALGMGLVAKLGESVLARLRERFVERALSLPADRLERAGAGDLTARVTTDVARVSAAVRSALPELARSGLTIVLTMVALVVLDWRFLLAALLAAPVQAWTARWYVRRAVPLYARQRVAGGAQQQQLLETIGGADTVRAYSLEEEHTERVARRSREAVALSLRGVRLVLGFYGRLHVAEYPGLVAVLCAGFVLGARQRRVGGHGDRGGALLPQPVRAGERRLGASTSPTRSTCSTSSSTSTGTRAAPS